MKKTINLMLLAILSILLSCTPMEKENTLPLSLDITSVDFGGLGGEQKIISVTSGSDWYARATESWLRVLVASGDGSNQASKCRITVEDNFSGQPRTGKITFTNLAGDRVELGISQDFTTVPQSTRGISSAEDLMNFVSAVNGEGSVAIYLVDGVVKLNNDIDCSTITEWVPIGTQEIPLIYDFDGNNKTLRNVHWTIDVTRYPAAGFIGVAEGVKIRRLTLGVKGTDKIDFVGSSTAKVRAGGIIGRAQNVVLEKVINNAALEVKGTTATGNDLILGGIAGYSDGSSLLGGDLISTKGCRSQGNITVPVVAQAGGIVGYNSGTIKNCTFDATITGPSNGTDGPGWLCSRNKAATAKVVSNVGKGFVGDTPSMVFNAMMNYKEGYDLEANTVDASLDAYYDWTTVETRSLHAGASYAHYRCKNVPREIFVVEVDLTNPNIELAAAWANDMIPNPNGNGNNNNGFCLRQRLSDVCTTQRNAGKKVLAGVNAGFFDSNEGIGRGFYVEDGKPLYINSPIVAKNNVNHAWAITVFTDGTASCGKKTFSGKLKANGSEYDFHSVNDTTLRKAHGQVNLFTRHYVKQPYPKQAPEGNPSLTNKLANNALYVICEWDNVNAPMKVNTGYASATVKEIKDGRQSALSSSALPYITQNNRIGIALSGATAEQWKAFIRVGSKVEFKCDIAVDGVSPNKPILTQVSTMFQVLTDGQDASNTVPVSHNFRMKHDPMTFPVVSKDLKKVWLVEVDGRDNWYSWGVTGYEVYQIAKKLGGWWATRLDGGGSACMWVWKGSSGSIVNRPCDTNKNGSERSCMNYLLVREK